MNQVLIAFAVIAALSLMSPAMAEQPTSPARSPKNSAINADSADGKPPLLDTPDGREGDTTQNGTGPMVFGLRIGMIKSSVQALVSLYELKDSQFRNAWYTKDPLPDETGYPDIPVQSRVLYFNDLNQLWRVRIETQDLSASDAVQTYKYLKMRLAPRYKSVKWEERYKAVLYTEHRAALCTRKALDDLGCNREIIERHMDEMTTGAELAQVLAICGAIPPWNITYRNERTDYKLSIDGGIAAHTKVSQMTCRPIFSVVFDIETPDNDLGSVKEMELKQTKKDAF